MAGIKDLMEALKNKKIQEKRRKMWVGGEVKESSDGMEPNEQDGTKDETLFPEDSPGTDVPEEEDEQEEKGYFSGGQIKKPAQGEFARHLKMRMKGY